jgi:D-3-phosphoglycerate dehydrogenase / 2-oxoglutarate reductase
MMSNVLVFSNLSRTLPGWDEAMKMIREAGHEVFDPGEKDLDEEAAIARLRGANAVFVGLNRLTGRAIESAKRLIVIAKPGIGVDNIDVDTATREGILVCNTPGSNAQSVADHLFGLMIAVARRLPYLDGITKAGRGWESWPVVGAEISGKKLGVIGTGSIGKAVIRRAKGFDMDILAYDPLVDEDLVRTQSVRYLPLGDLLRDSDFVTVHVPLTHETRGLIGEVELSSMKKTACLFNTSRGGIVDEKALIDALRKGRIAGAGIDVFEQEPLEESELFGLGNVVLTPHVAGYSPEASYRSRIMSAENIINALRGIKPHVVNPEVLRSPGIRIKIGL